MDNLSQFHYLATQIPAHFDHSKEEFDIKDIYQYYALKVTGFILL